MFDIGQTDNYFNDSSETDLNNHRVLRKVADKCYLPTNQILKQLLLEHPELKLSFSFSGVVLEQFENMAPEVLVSFQELVATGQVEVLAETYYHSLAALYSESEFEEQVKKHTRTIERLFGLTPKVFRNTELIYRNDIAAQVSDMGFSGMLAEGADHVLGWCSPNFVYRAENCGLNLLLKNYRLSDDIAFRFSSRDWTEWPLSAEKFASWVSDVNGGGQVINLFMDYETFGEHQWADTGIFDFLQVLPREILKHPDNDFVTPSEALNRYSVRGDLNIPYYLSWADVGRDISAWLENNMQKEAFRVVYQLEPKVKESQDERLKDIWGRLQTSDHFYYMCTKWFADGDVHAYFSPWGSPYDAFISYMNALNDFELRLNKVLKEQPKDHSLVCSE